MSLTSSGPTMILKDYEFKDLQTSHWKGPTYICLKYGYRITRQKTREAARSYFGCNTCALRFCRGNDEKIPLEFREFILFRLEKYGPECQQFKFNRYVGNPTIANNHKLLTGRKQYSCN